MTMTEAPLKQMSDGQLLDLERAYWMAIKGRDALAAGRMTAEDCTLVGATGVTDMDARTMARNVGSAPSDLKEFTIDPSTVRITRLGDDVALIAYGVQKEVQIEGQHVHVEAFDSSLWRREHGEWTCVLHTESIAGDPFGRDRKPSANLP